MSAISGLAVIMAAVSMVMDLRTAKIDNGWVAFCLCTGLVTRLLQEGTGGFFGCLCGIILPAVLLGWLFTMRMLGAGDIKLMCALGSILGTEKILKCIIYSFFIGAGISIAILISNGNISQRFLYFSQYVRNLLRTGERKPYCKTGMASPENFHFTVPVFLSVLLYAGGVY